MRTKSNDDADADDGKKRKNNGSKETKRASESVKVRRVLVTGSLVRIIRRKKGSSSFAIICGF